MIEYRSIPLDIRESGEVQSLARKIAAWSSIHILQEYIKVLRLFHQSMTKGREYLLTAAYYYLLRKELFRRMSPFVGKRDTGFIFQDNKHLISSLNRGIEEGFHIRSREMKPVILEICRRMS